MIKGTTDYRGQWGMTVDDWSGSLNHPNCQFRLMIAAQLQPVADCLDQG